jgi:hypothetical protein
VRRFPITIRLAGIATGVYVALWCAASFIFDIGFINTAGWAVFYLIGLCWVVYFVERAARNIEAKYRSADHAARPLVVVGGELTTDRRGGWNPLDPASKLYGRTSQKLRQSFATLAAYSLLFMLVYFLAHIRFGVDSSEEDELPAGGGSDSVQASSVRVQKVIRKKYVVNPYSSILFAAPPPIDQIDPKLSEETANLYKVGQGSGATGDGDGEGAGFGSGTGKGKATFVRLRHGDRGWDRNYGIDGDRNMLKEYGLRTRQKIAEETEYIEAATAPKRAPAMLYISGIQSLPLTAGEKKSLREYIMDKHGMIVGDNHGGGGFHSSFETAMNEITGTKAVPIPRDDTIHQKPYALPQLPIVVAHGGTTPLGWRVDGRWAVYYHPGALSDAWRDDRAGIRKEIAELCYQLGVNVMYYSMRERNKWNQSQKP